jgi:hypothetical protein
MEERIAMMLPQLNEMQRRLFLAGEALSYGRGGIAEVIRISGVSRNTIKRGISELKSGVKFNGKVVADPNMRKKNILKLSRKSGK